jgi:hypothetical protein
MVNTLFIDYWQKLPLCPMKQGFHCKVDAKFYVNRVWFAMVNFAETGDAML